MPSGFGYRPQSGGIDTQLSTLTRRAELAKVVVQIWNSSPTICALLSNAQLEAGGIDSVVANVQYAQLVQPQWTSFQGNFSAPSVVQGIQPATWTFCWAVCPIPVMISELLIQDEQAIQSILNLRMTDAGNSMRDMIAFSLFNNTANPLQILGLPVAVDDGTAAATYGGITRAANAWWQSPRINVGGTLTRANLSQYIMGVVARQGEAPDFIMMHPAAWVNLYSDILATGSAGSERYWPNQDKTDKYLSSFRAIEVAGVPVYMDPYVPNTTGAQATNIAYLINTNYLTMKVHQQAQWEFMDFVPMTPVYQLSYTGVAYIVLALVNTKPLSCMKLYNITTTAI
ncbi:MAG: phage major capsid protein [Acidobacteria bacterium]|nr:MAG: phage major capsid protein [Acidobacteriota bacterium]